MAPRDLYIMRHGDAEHAHPEHPGDDDRRRLTPAGAARTARVARGLERYGVVPAVVWTSPRARARETADIIADALEPREGVRVVHELAAPGHRDALAVIAAAPADVLLIVGHQPMIGDLVSSLVTTGAVRQRFEETLTAHLRLHAFSGRLAGELVAYLPARVLEAAGSHS